MLIYPGTGNSKKFTTSQPECLGKSGDWNLEGTEARTDRCPEKRYGPGGGAQPLLKLRSHFQEAALGLSFLLPSSFWSSHWSNLTEIQRTGEHKSIFPEETDQHDIYIIYLYMIYIYIMLCWWFGFVFFAKGRPIKTSVFSDNLGWQLPRLPIWFSSVQVSSNEGEILGITSIRRHYRKVNKA